MDRPARRSGHVDGRRERRCTRGRHQARDVLWRVDDRHDHRAFAQDGREQHRPELPAFGHTRAGRRDAHLVRVPHRHGRSVHQRQRIRDPLLAPPAVGDDAHRRLPSREGRPGCGPSAVARPRRGRGRPRQREDAARRGLLRPAMTTPSRHADPAPTVAPPMDRSDAEPPTDRSRAEPRATPDRPRGPLMLAVWTIVLVVGFAAVLTLGAPLPSSDDELAGAYSPPTPVTEAVAIASADTIVRLQYPAMRAAERTVTRRDDLGVDRFVIVY